jgi:hypothetical protein
VATRDPVAYDTRRIAAVGNDGWLSLFAAEYVHCEAVVAEWDELVVLVGR